MSVEIKKSLFDFDVFYAPSEGSDSTLPNLGQTGSADDATNNGLVRVEGPAVFSGGDTTNTLLQQFSGLPTGTWPTSDKATFRVVLNSEAATRNAGQYVILGGNSTHSQVHINPAQGDVIMRVLDSAFSAAGFVWVWDKPANFWPLDTAFWFEYDVLNPGVDGSDVICRYSEADTPTPPTVWDEETTLIATATNDPACANFAYTELNIGRHSSTIEMPTMSTKYVDCERVVSGQSYRVWFTGDDITATELGADEMVISSPALGPAGEGLTIRRAATGPVTTIVPSGNTEYILATENAGDDLKTATVSAIAEDEDMVLAFVFRPGNIPLVNGTFFTAASTYWRMNEANTNIVFQVAFASGTVNFYQNQVSLVSRYDRHVLVAQVDRSSDLVRLALYGPDGQKITSNENDITGSTTIPSGDLGFTGAVPIAAGPVAYNSGFRVALDDDTVDEIAQYLLSIEDNLFIDDELDPNFDLKNNFLQPHTPRSRVPYRSPIDSEQLNLFYNSTVNDINKLYTEYDLIQEDISVKMQQMYEDGPGELKYQDRVESIYYYADQLATIRSQIENLR